MKRIDFLKHLKKHGCIFDREGSSHTIYKNTITNSGSPIPRHNEIDKKLVKIICNQLQVPFPDKY